MGMSILKTACTAAAAVCAASAPYWLHAAESSPAKTQRGTATVHEGERVEYLPFGDMESWTVRNIKESRLLGGKTKTIYVCGPTDTINRNEAYDYSKTIWGISNAYANVMGIAKAAVSTQPERRGDGYCARLDTRMETVEVLGVVDIKVCVVGTMFLGSVLEPVRSASDPYGSINMGIPFSGKPKALLLDLKAKVSESREVIKALGFGVSVIEGHDEPEVYVYLQKRWEDSNGNIFAKRIGTARHRFSESMEDWHNDYRVDIHYGDITSEPFFRKYMGLFPDGGQFRALNSKGEMKNITETGWGSPEDEPTHIILMVTAGCYPAFYGTPGNALWVDNIRLVY